MMHALRLGNAEILLFQELVRYKNINQNIEHVHFAFDFNFAVFAMTAAINPCLIGFTQIYLDVPSPKNNFRLRLTTTCAMTFSGAAL